MPQHERPERRERHSEATAREPDATPAAAAVAREPAPPAAQAVLGLQRTAGNRAVSALLARQPAPADAGPKPADSRKAATMTVGLGKDDEFVIPVDSMQWQGEKSLVVFFGGDNPAFSDLHEAWAKGRRFDTGFASTRALMSRLAGVTIESIEFSTAGGEAAVAMTLSVDAVKHDPVK